MLLIRRFEEKAGEAYSLGKIGGFCHLYIGQEAVAVGTLAAMRGDDYITASYREHGHALARGMSARAAMAELFGKAAGCSHGKGGSMHLFDASLGFLGGHGIVGGHIPLTTGMAFAIKYREERPGRRVLLRRGRREQRRVPRGAQHGRALEAAGDLHLREQPLRHGHRAGAGQRRSTTSRSAPAPTTWTAKSWTDRTCWRCTQAMAARREARAREQASRPCSRSAPTASWATRCPTRSTGTTAPGKRSRSTASATRSLVWSEKLKADGLIDEQGIKALDADVISEVEDAYRFADAAPDPEPGELWTDVYADDGEPS